MFHTQHFREDVFASLRKGKNTEIDQLKKVLAI